MSGHHLTCEEVLERLFAYLDGEVDDEIGEDIDGHLARCRDCFTRAEFERALRAKVNAAGSQAAPERLRNRIKGFLDRY